MPSAANVAAQSTINFGLLKRSIIGSYHHLSVKHRQAYLDELAFRYNNRENPFLFRDQMRAVMAQSLALYLERHAGHMPRRVVIHKNTEWKGYEIDGAFEVRITASFGIATYPNHALSKDGLIRQADEAMGSRLVPLDDAGLKAKFNRAVNVQVAVDPELIGGAVITIGDQVIDGSVKGRLQRMSFALRA